VPQHSTILTNTLGPSAAVPNLGVPIPRSWNTSWFKYSDPGSENPCIYRNEQHCCHFTHPLCVTRHCLRPSFRKISTTISIGVWSVTVKGLISSMLLSFKGRGLSAGSDGVCWAKQTLELPTIPSCFFLALSLRKRGGGGTAEKEEFTFLE